MSQSIDGDHRFYHYDGFHNTRSLTDMNGAVTDTYRYDAYGTLLEQTGSTTNPYLYRGEQCDAETDAYYLLARSYQPATGRFLTTDPVEGNTSDPITLHRYLYGKNDPVNNINPSGEMTFTDTQLTAGIVGILSGISVGGWALGNVLPDQYAWLAENLFPDAGIIGISAFGKININSRVMREIKELLQFMKPGGGFPSQIFQPDYWPYHPCYDPSTQVSGGIIFGGEAMWSFGSSQWGLFWYWGPQVEIQRYQPKLGGFDVSISTGYVFNLWNCMDYTGAFRSVNFPGGSFFFDPGRLSGNKGPWGVSWPILSFGGSQTFVGANQTDYKHPLIQSEVPYGVLAADWPILQAASTAHFVLTYNKSAYVTAVGTAFPGASAKSNQSIMVEIPKWKRLPLLADSC